MEQEPAKNSISDERSIVELFNEEIERVRSEGWSGEKKRRQK